MSNPAQLLLDQFQQWHDPRASAVNARFNGEKFPNAWEDHRRAMRHIDNIVILLDQMDAQGKSTRLYRDNIGEWTAFVLNFARDWNSAQTGGVSGHPVQILEALAGRFEDLVPRADQASFDNVRGFLTEIQEALEDTDWTAGVPVDLIRHSQQLIAHVRWCLDNYATVGDFELQDAMDRLEVDLFRVARSANEPGRWSKFWQNWATPFTVNMISAAPSQLAINALMN